MASPRLGVVVRGAEQPLRVFADELLAELRDPDGRPVVLLARIWEDKITKDHPELRAHLEHVLSTVTHPDHAEPDPREAAPLLPPSRGPEPVALLWS